MRTLFRFSFKNAAAFLIILAVFAAGALAQMPQYYNLNTGTSSNSFPFNVAAGKAVNSLFLAGEFNQPTPLPAGQQITTVYLRTSTAGTRTFTNLHILMAQDVITTLTTGQFYPGPYDTVYFNPSATLTSVVDGWMSVTLNRPYPYDPTKSLILFVGQCGATGSGMSVRNSTLTATRRVWSVGGCPFVPYTSGDAATINFGMDVEPAAAPGWSAQTSGITTALNSVKAVNQYVVWAGGNGGVVLRTTDAGSTWTSVGGGNIGTAHIYNVEAISATTAFVTTSPADTYIFRTTNGGTTWDTVFTQAGGFLNAIHMFNANTGIAQGDPVGATWTVIRTTDGGASWARIATEPPVVGGEYGANNGMKVIGTTHIWWTPGTGNGFYRSTDGGATWNRVTLPASGFTAGVNFLNTQYGVVGNSGGSAARTTDGGATWTPVTIGTSGAIYGVGAAGTLNLWATRGTTIQKSVNRGAAFTQEFSDAAAGTFNHCSFFAASGFVRGWAVTAAGKIYAYFNPVDARDIGVASLTRFQPTSDQMESVRPATPEQSESLADAAQRSLTESDEISAGLELTPLPESFYPLADTLFFRAIVKNYGTLAETAYQLGWQADGVIQTPISVTDSLRPGERDTLILQWNDVSQGTHTIRAWTILADDANRANDTATHTFLVAGNFWTSVTPSPNALSRSCVAYVTINDTGYVYQFGGGSGTQLTSVARYNTVTDTWSTTFGPMAAAVSSGTAIPMGNNMIYVFGGENTAVTLGSTQRYDVGSDTWTLLAPMPTAVTDAAVVKYRDSLVYVIGGGNGLFGTVVYSTVQFYNINTNTWTSATPYPLAVGMTGCGIFRDTIIVAGGWNGTTGNPSAYKGVINAADPTQINWLAIDPYPLGGVTRMASVFVSRGTGAGIMFAGGAINGATLTARAYLWNVCNNVWEPLDTFTVARSNMKAAGPGTNLAWVVGGYTTVGVGNTDKATFTSIPGGCFLVGVSEPTAVLPTSYELAQNYPNPFNPTTVINYAIPKTGLVTLKVFDLLGREAATLVNENRPAGYHTAVLDGSRLSSGVYFYRLQASGYSATKKLMLVR